jgi:hypothetical protein
MLPTLSTRWFAAISEALPASSRCRTVRYLGVEVDDALEIAERIEV